jgi:hypothetical protein
LIQTGIQSGQSYSFRVRGKNKWGFGPYSDTVLIEASANPDTAVSTPTVLNSGLDIVISWPSPANKGASILEYNIIAIVGSEALTFEADVATLGCDGQSPETIESRSCSIQVQTFRSVLNVDYPDTVKAKIRSRNSNGWSNFSETSLTEALIMTEPADMGICERGHLSDQYHVHIVWQELVGEKTRGSPITSYVLQWDQGTGGLEWHDLVGLTDPYLGLEYVAYFGDVVPGTTYQVRMKAENLFGFSNEWSPSLFITADSKPDPADIVSTSLVSPATVRIEWSVPANNYADLLRYELLIATKEGQLIEHNLCADLGPV